MTIHVVGGLYRETCIKPGWDRYYGSGGRAAEAITAMKSSSTLHTYAEESVVDAYVSAQLYSDLKVSVKTNLCHATIAFEYLHDSDVPRIINRYPIPLPPITVEEEKVIRFGMLEGDALVRADWVVYDPQNEGDARRFSSNGSTANHLALILGLRDARQLVGNSEATPDKCAKRLADADGAEVVVIKLGPVGVYVWTKDEARFLPAFRAESVWKIGTGDVFVAHFAKCWMQDRRPPMESAMVASQAVAGYCATQTLPRQQDFVKFEKSEIKVSEQFFDGRRPRVYLAGAFENTAQVWLGDAVSSNLQSLGLEVISPLEQLKLNINVNPVQFARERMVQADLVFAIFDGRDEYVIHQIHSALSLGLHVVMLCESTFNTADWIQSSPKWVVCDNYTTALYSTAWIAVGLTKEES